MAEAESWWQRLLHKQKQTISVLFKGQQQDRTPHFLTID